MLNASELFLVATWIDIGAQFRNDPFSAGGASVGGEVLVFGTLTGGNQGLPYYQLYFKELTIYNPRAAVIGDYALGIELAGAGRLDLEPIVSHQLTLDDAGQAFELVHDPSSMKVLMKVG